MLKDTFGKLGEHARGELLPGLANGHRILDDAAKAPVISGRIQKERLGTPYANRAAIRFKTKSLTAAKKS